MDSGMRAPHMVSKSPVRSRYTDANTKSPMKGRNLGASALNDIDGGNVGIGGRTPTRTSNSPLKSRHVDASRRTPTRERIGSSDANRKSPLRGRIPIDAKNKSSGRSADADNRKSPLRRSVVPNHDEMKANVKISVNSTESFNVWLPSDNTADQKQVELNKPSASPRIRRTWGSQDPSIGFDIKQNPGPVRGIPNRIDDDWVQEDDYGGGRRNTDMRYEDRYVELLERPRGRMEQLEDERVGFRGKPRHRVPIESHEPPSNYRSGRRYGYDELQASRAHYNGPANLHNVALKQAEILRMYNELGEEIGRIGNLSYSHGRQSEFYCETNDYVQCSGHNGSPRMMHNYVSDRPIPSRFLSNESPLHDDFSSPHTPHFQQQYASRTEYKTRPNRHNNLSSHSRSSAESAKKLVVVNQNQQLCHPIAGGAPFVICSKCSKLLRLPKKFRTMTTNQIKLQCGSCRVISSFDFSKKNTNSKPIDVHVPVELVSISEDKNDGHNSVAGLANRESFQFTKMRHGLSPSSSSSSHASKDDKSSEAVGQDDKPLMNSVLPLRPPPGSPLRYHMDYSDILTADIAAKLKLDFDEDPKDVGSQGSVANVYVNGQLITRDAVRSAEKMAGTISSGAYWYDKRAGFWGIMGGHCLGIIAPFIEEFKAQMPENCSGGDTCIYVNGRELHKHDLDMLSGRGLPRTRYKYYVVDLSGKVEDEDTGRFVVNIGKLAPNVERTGRGFGMQPPEIQSG